MNLLRKIIGKIWRMTPTWMHWRLLWLLNAKFNVGVSGLITNSAGQVLLLRHVVRRTHPWGLPSGWVKSGETAAAALVREVREEIGLTVTPGKLIHVADGYALRVEIVLDGTLESTAGARYGLEVTEAVFCDPRELPAGLLPAHRELIDRVLGTGNTPVRRLHVH